MIWASLALAGHGDVEIADARADVGDDRGDLRAAVGLRAVVDIDADRPVVFADAVDAAGDVEFGAERDLEEAVDDFGVGEALALGRAAVGDLGVLGRGGRRGQQRASETSATPQLTGQRRASGRPCAGALGTAERHDVRALMPPHAAHHGG